VVPDPTKRAPLLPSEALPVLNANKPLTPAVPESADSTIKFPLDDCVPKPLEMMTRPPEEYDEVPAERIISPPDPLLPDPT
jgi:hypothetical protein